MTTQPTPGPWTVRRDVLDRDSFDVLAPNEDAGKQGVSYAGDYFMVAHGLDSEADARLIAAAPRMLDELQRIIDTMPLGSAWARLTADRVGALLREIHGEG